MPNPISRLMTAIKEFSNDQLRKNIQALDETDRKTLNHVLNNISDAGTAARPSEREFKRMVTDLTKKIVSKVTHRKEFNGVLSTESLFQRIFQLKTSAEIQPWEETNQPEGRQLLNQPLYKMEKEIISKKRRLEHLRRTGDDSKEVQAEMRKLEREIASLRKQSDDLNRKMHQG